MASLDPGRYPYIPDGQIERNLFNGLYRFDKDLNVVPDIATSLPEISSDGLTWTFRLRSGVKFSNGDPVTSRDVLYSWNRKAYVNDSSSTSFASVVVGGADVLANKVATMSGLTAPDDLMVVAKLTAPAAWWLYILARYPAYIVSQKAIGDYADKNNQKNLTWAASPETQIGTGPFRMVARVPKASMDFEAVPNWWGGSTGKIKKVHIEVVSDPVAQVAKYESGGFDVLGMAQSTLDNATILRYSADPAKSKELVIGPGAQTSWVGFNLKTGPFAGDAGRDGRLAFSLAINREQLVDISCSGGLLCSPATGGIITKGMNGYLGDDKDPNAPAKGDAAKAKSLYEKWDPDRKKAAELKFSFNTSAFNQTMAENLQSQWKSVLGVDVKLEAIDATTYFARRNKQEFTMFLRGWTVDYNHPQNWFASMFTCAQSTPGRGGAEGYCNPELDKLTEEADRTPLEKALPLYEKAQQLLIQDVVYADLYYLRKAYITRPYLQGAGGSALYDHPWSELAVLRH